MSRPIVMVATPCGDLVHSGYTLDISMLLLRTFQEGIQTIYAQNRGTIIPQQRATLVHQASEIGATHILFVDSDMRFPKDSLLRLLAHDKPIVAANYARRRTPVLPTAEAMGDDGKICVFTTEESTGLERVLFCGFGLILVRMDVFDKIGDPWFQIGFDKELQYVGEDFFFCAKCRQNDIDVLIDHDLSKEVRHIGAFEYMHAHCEQTRSHFAPKIEAPKIELVTNGAR